MDYKCKEILEKYIIIEAAGDFLFVVGGSKWSTFHSFPRYKLSQFSYATNNCVFHSKGLQGHLILGINYGEC